MNDAQSTSAIQVISNEVFLKAIFGDKHRTTHTTSFLSDPLKAERSVWGGKYYAQHFAGVQSPSIESWDYNNYFVISTFGEDPHDDRVQARRRKNLFEQCYLVVVDDVHSKVPASKLSELGFPAPTYKLETSPGNEQWGYVFSRPVTQRNHIEYLLDSWVKQGISCDGKDPGMKGVTRYVRLPIGSNTKAEYGKPHRHVMKAWHPEIRYSMDHLCKATGIDLAQCPLGDELRPQQILDDDKDPLLKAIADSGRLLKKLSPGKFEITCPWIDGHSARANTGAAYLQPAGFRCHHGSCEGRTGVDLRRFLQDEGFLHKMTAEEMFPMERGPGDEATGEPEPARVAKHIYIRQLDRFYWPETELFHTRDQMNAMFPPGAKQPKYVTAFFDHGATLGYSMVDKITYKPGAPVIDYNELNLWRPGSLEPVEGDVGPWLALAERLFPVEAERRHILSWLAYTLQHPGEKINHCLLIVGPVQGQGKDTFIEPLIEGLGRDNCSMVFPKEFHGGYNDFLKGNKLLVVQEIMDFGKAEVEHYLKPLLAAPPSEVAISEKYVGRYMLPNIWNFIMFSNELNAAKVGNDARRYFCVRTDAGPLGDMAESIWDWYYNQQGLAKVYDYLLTYDVSGFSAKTTPPATSFKGDLAEMSKTEIELDVERVLEETPEKWDNFEISLLQERMNELKTFGQVTNLYSSKRLGLTLRKMGYFQIRKFMGGQNKRLWISQKLGE